LDTIVKQALAKWPDVPDCYGWLGLDARGNWYMRDESVQARGPFSSGAANGKGALLKNQKLIEFIGRNYEHNALGQWFFQNGPQRVYVELEATPLIWRVDPDLSVQDHIGRAARVTGSVLDENGRLYLETDLGFGLVHSMDMGHAASAVEQGRWLPRELLCADLPARFGYVTSPQALRS